MHACIVAAGIVGIVVYSRDIPSQLQAYDVVKVSTTILIAHGGTLEFWLLFLAGVTPAAYDIWSNL